MKKFIFSTLTLSLLAINVHSQIAIRHSVATPKPADSLDIAYYGNKKWLQASTTAFGVNMGVWAFDRFVQDAHYAHINFKTMHENLKKGFIWDNDNMAVNMFLHPYHGNLYFNAGRSNGLNYWESGAVALGGSAMWELFMESEYPSTNDIIATPIGGMAMGEVLYRTSDLILDDRRVGWSRFGHEFAGFLVSPMRGLTRVINGDAWRKRPTSGKQFGVPDVAIDISMGVRALELKDEIFDQGIGFATTINVEYGDRFEAETNKPFDYFTFRANVNGQGSQPILSQMNIMGRLYSMELIDNSKDFLSLGVYQHYDFYDSDTISDVSNKIPYKFSAPASFGLGLIHMSKRFADWNFNSQYHLNAILLGASQSDHYELKNRNYNLGSGLSWKFGWSIAYKDIFSASANYEGYTIYTWKGYKQDIDWSTVDERTLNAQGDKSRAILHAISLRADLKLKKHWYLTTIGYNFTRDTNYKYFDDIFSKTSEGRLMLTYKF